MKPAGLNIKLIEKTGIALVTIALSYNIYASWALYSSAPLSDPASYPVIAKASHYFYDSGMREPVPVFLTKALLALGAGDQAAVRLATVIVFAASVLLLLFFADRAHGLLAGLTSAMLFAVNPYAGYYSVQGVSNLTSGLFLMIFCFGLAGKDMSGRNAVFLGVAGGLCMLSRLENILIVLAALGIGAVLDLSKRRARFSAFVFAVAIFLTLPYLAHQYREYGNPVYSHAMAARFWQNTEKSGPLSGDRYSGGPMSISSFVLRAGPAAAAGNLLKAYAGDIFHYIPRLLHYKILMLALFSGMFFLFKKKDYFALLLLPVLMLPVSFISSIDQVSAGSGIELRFYLNALWLVCVYCGMGLSGAVSLITKRNRLQKT
ncbi:MAG: glycosyltransferase family 39 protein [Elusimicrobia bacterium]|nr:glycosyltransferase family 39 protein [Elusimicrobiota bacterium]